MHRALIIVGPTATGKTALGIHCTRELDGILFSADSIQAYTGLDIISGKDLPALAHTPVRLLDIVPPTESFNVSDFLKECERRLEAVPNNKMPVIVGGTAFYIKALLQEFETVHIPPNKILREKLEIYTVPELQKMLEQGDSVKLHRMNNSDRNNPRRLIRALEIIHSKQDSKASTHERSILANYNIKIIGLIADLNTLRKRITERVHERIKSGAVEEARKLFEQYDSLASQVKTASGYKELFAYLQNKITLEDAVLEWKIAEIQNAKKQITFFKKIKGITWFNIAKEDYLQEVNEYARAW